MIAHIKSNCAILISIQHILSQHSMYCIVVLLAVILSITTTQSQPSTATPATPQTVGFVNDSPFYQIVAAPTNGADYFTPVHESGTSSIQLHNNVNIPSNPTHPITSNNAVYHNTATFINKPQLYNCTVNNDVALLFHQYMTSCGTHCIQLNIHTLPSLNTTDVLTAYIRCNGNTINAIQLMNQPGNNQLIGTLHQNKYCNVNTNDYLELFYIIKNKQHHSCQTDYYAYQIPPQQ